MAKEMLQHQKRIGICMRRRRGRRGGGGDGSRRWGERREERKGERKWWGETNMFYQIINDVAPCVILSGNFYVDAKSSYICKLFKKQSLVVTN